MPRRRLSALATDGRDRACHALNLAVEMWNQSRTHDGGSVPSSGSCGPCPPPDLVPASQNPGGLRGEAGDRPPGRYPRRLCPPSRASISLVFSRNVSSAARTPFGRKAAIPASRWTNEAPRWYAFRRERTVSHRGIRHYGVLGFPRSPGRPSSGRNSARSRGANRRRRPRTCGTPHGSRGRSPVPPG